MNTLNSVLSISVMLLFQNPREQMILVQISLFIVMCSFPCVTGFWHWCRPSEKSNHTLALCHVPFLKSWNLLDWRFHTHFSKPPPNLRSHKIWEASSPLPLSLLSLAKKLRTLGESAQAPIEVFKYERYRKGNGCERSPNLTWSYTVYPP